MFETIQSVIVVWLFMVFVILFKMNEQYHYTSRIWKRILGIIMVRILGRNETAYEHLTNHTLELYGNFTNSSDGTTDFTF